MDFLEYIKSLNNNELNSVVGKRIKYLENIYESSLDNIGFQVDYNPKCQFFTNISNEYDYGVLCIYRGYIVKNTKITYGITNDFSKGLVYNEGCYYYLDDDTYILDFCKFIKNIDVSDEYDLFDYVLLFLENYFGYFKDMNRSDMFKMIYNENGLFYDPINEHKFSSFKKKGNAICSEYAITAQNILSIFGFDTYLVFGTYGKTFEKDDDHAFNLISFERCKDSEIVNALIDFSNSSVVLDINLKKVCRSPFIGYLECLDEDFINDLINNDKHLIFDDYNYMIFLNNIFKIGNDLKRDYYLDVVKQKEYVKRLGSGCCE